MVNILKLKQICQKDTQCKCVQFHLPCYKQPSLFISKTSKAWIVENSPFFTCCHVCTYLQLQSHMWYCIVYTMSTTISRPRYFCPKPIWHFSHLNHWKYVKTLKFFNHKLDFYHFKPINDGYWYMYWITLHLFQGKKDIIIFGLNIEFPVIVHRIHINTSSKSRDA